MVFKIKMALVKTGRANMPEIGAYCRFFSNYYDVSVCEPNEDLSSYDILWYFMGSKGKRYRKEQFIVHEYASLSVPPYAKVKNWIKKNIISQPDLRVFLNNRIRDELGFTDSVQYCYRDMGVDELFFTSRRDFKFDIVYVGAVAGRNLEKALDVLLSYELQCEILIIGKVDSDFQNSYSGKNVKFIGQVDYNKVPEYIGQAKLCLNWIPDVYPYNLQTSTKYLEYVAGNRLVISNSYPWINFFTRENNLTYIDLNNKSEIINALNNPTVGNYNFKPMKWDEVINASMVLDLLPR
ncbi:glycosyltransferase [Pectobacterium punjabense]|uniref:glycosyltransferase n=1 Tax=Pectobacterium punjabense TaxID=2108399 RepID=UPI002B23EEA6|nr:glycosyltransferase [Pectobacterium punjabense]